MRTDDVAARYELNALCGRKNPKARRGVDAAHSYQTSARGGGVEENSRSLPYLQIVVDISADAGAKCADH
jgi:hypothetical protein